MGGAANIAEAIKRMYTIPHQTADRFSFISLFIVIFVYFTLGACTPFIEIIEVGPEQAQQLRSEIEIVRSGSLEADEYTMIGSVSATSCKARAWDPDASEEDATNQILYKASELGADAIYDLKCDELEGTSFSENCWNSLTCKAVAIERD
jgi:hypothetical protein